MTWQPRHEQRDDQLVTDTLARLVCRCGWTSRPVLLPSWDMDDDTYNAASDIRSAVWVEHYAPLITPPPDQVLILDRDAGGWRHYLAGQPIHAGSPLDLLLQGGTWWPGRYESAWPPGWETTGPVALFYAALGGPWDTNDTDTSVTVSFPLPASAVLRWPLRPDRW